MAGISSANGHQEIFGSVVIGNPFSDGESQPRVPVVFADLALPKVARVHAEVNAVDSSSSKNGGRTATAQRIGSFALQVLLLRVAAASIAFRPAFEVPGSANKCFVDRPDATAPAGWAHPAAAYPSDSLRSSGSIRAGVSLVPARANRSE
jgi:hypothetical protein